MSYKFNNEYSRLNEAARKDPLTHLRQYVGDKDLFNHREVLYHWFRTAITTQTGDFVIEASEYPDQFWYFEITLYCVEMCYKLRDMVYNKEIVFAYKEPQKPTQDGTNRS